MRAIAFSFNKLITVEKSDFYGQNEKPEGIPANQNSTHAKRIFASRECLFLFIDRSNGQTERGRGFAED